MENNVENKEVETVNYELELKEVKKTVKKAPDFKLADFEKERWELLTINLSNALKKAFGNNAEFGFFQYGRNSKGRLLFGFYYQPIIDGGCAGKRLQLTGEYPLLVNIVLFIKDSNGSCKFPIRFEEYANSKNIFELVLPREITNEEAKEFKILSTSDYFNCKNNPYNDPFYIYFDKTKVSADYLYKFLKERAHTFKKFEKPTYNELRWSKTFLIINGQKNKHFETYACGPGVCVTDGGYQNYLKKVEKDEWFLYKMHSWEII